MPKTYLNWSSGKDALLALHHLQNTAFQPEKLVCTINTEFNRVSMHGLPVNLLQQQANALNLHLHIIELPGELSLNAYNQLMQKSVSQLQEEGFTHSVFGDIFLEDLRTYRENQLKPTALSPIFPLWKKNTRELLKEFIDLGYKGIVVCTDAQKLDQSFCGRLIDDSFLADLPADVDPCGEHGEFHTFVFDGPLFNQPISFERGEKVLRSYSPSTDDQDDCFTDQQSWNNQFWYIDLI